jgi:hypothetical protein
MSLFLYCDKRCGKSYDLPREAQVGRSFTSVSCKPMIERTMHMSPTWIISGLAGSDQKIRTLFGKKMEYCVICRAYGALQIGLPRAVRRAG